MSNVPTLQKYDRQLRALILSHKKKDFAGVAKSVFYTLLKNVLKRVDKLELFRSLEILSTTAADLATKEPDSGLTPEEHARVTICMKLVKQV